MKNILKTDAEEVVEWSLKRFHSQIQVCAKHSKGAEEIVVAINGDGRIQRCVLSDPSLIEALGLGATTPKQIKEAV